MNRDDIIRMAREAGLYSGSPRTPSTGRMIEKRLERFAALVALTERDACASMFANEDCLFEGRHIAAAIRARGETK